MIRPDKDEWQMITHFRCEMWSLQSGLTTKQDWSQNNSMTLVLECTKNATWRWQWAHLVICTCDKHYLRFKTVVDGSNSMVLSFQHAFGVMNYCLVWFLVQSRRTDGRTDRQKVMHMSPLCNLHRWAQKTKMPQHRGTCWYGWILGPKHLFYSLVKLSHMWLPQLR